MGLGLPLTLQEEIYRLEKGIESDQKLKHMAELQISVVADPASKHQIQVGKVGGSCRDSNSKVEDQTRPHLHNFMPPVEPGQSYPFLLYLQTTLI